MFKTKKILTVVLAIVMLMQTLIVPGIAADINEFTDFPVNSWSTEAMTAAVDNGLLVGTSETTIEPQKNLTRAEFAAIVTRAFGATEKADVSNFKDVKSNDWFYDSVAKVVQMGVMNGTGETTFDPNSFMKREDVILAMARILFVNGDDSSVLDQFSDKAKIDNWSVKAIAGMVAEDYVHGYEDGTIRPLNYITREELAQLFHNIFKTYISEDGEVNSVAKKGSVVVRSKYVTLKDVTIDGDLIMADGIGDGDFRISNVHVTGKIIARGGEGMNYFVNVTSDGKVIVNDPNGTVNFYNYKEEDTPFKGGNVIENTPATFLEREPAKPSVGGGGGVTKKYSFFIYDSYEAIENDLDPEKSITNKTQSYKITESDVPTEIDGKKIAGWYKENDVEFYNRSDIVGKSIKSVAGNWYPVYKYTITFVTDAGENTVEKAENKSLEGSDIPEVTVDATKEFKGWTTVEGSDTVNFTNDALVAGTVKDVFGDETEIKLYPVIVDKGSAVKYVVNFNANGGSGSMAAQEIEEGVAANLNANTFTRDDYTFAGWNTKADGTGTSYADGASITLTETITLYAQWTYTPATKYYVTFDANGGSGSMDEQEFVSGVAGTLNAIAFTRNDYVFAGWNTEEDGTGTAYADGASITLTESITLYAQWTRADATKYYVTFNANGGSGSMAAQAFDKNVAGTLNANAFTRDDYTFAGWNTKDDGTGTAYADGASITLTESITLYAQWTSTAITKYYVTFNANGGSGSMDEQEFVSGVAGTLNANAFTRNDYVFAGWNTKDDGTGTAYADGASITLTESITLYAQWTFADATKYYVTFNANGGSGSMAAQAFDKNVAGTLNANAFTRDDYTFAGWNTKKDGTGTSYADGASITLTESITLYAQWTSTAVTKYYVTFDAHGGSGSMVAQELEAGVAANLNANAFTRNDYVFAGWNTEEDGTGTAYADGASITLTGSITLYAQWTWTGTTKYMVTFVAHGGSGSMDEQEFVSGVAGTLNANAFTRNDYVFAGWNTKEDGTGTAYADGASITLTESITLYAQWTFADATKYYVTFNANGGSGSMAAQGLDKNVAGTLNANAFTREDYTFAGWNTKADGTGTAYADGASITLTESITLYAQWASTAVTKYYVTFDANGGSGSMDEQEFVADTAQNLSANSFTRANYSFAGWNTKADGTGTAYADGASITLTESITLYAQWTSTAVTKYYVTFDANGGSGSMDEQEFVSGVAGTLKANAFTRNDYVFAGWNTKADGTGTAYADGASITLTESITLYAQWTSAATTKYYVTFNANGGTGIMAPQAFDKNTAGNLNANAFARADYRFTGWNTKEDGTGTAYADGASITLTESITLYAQWEYTLVSRYFVTFVANGGNGTITTQEFEEGVAENLDANPFEKLNYKFTGWNTKEDGTGTSYDDGASVTLTESITLYAQWESTIVIKYFVTFVGNGGSGSMDEQEFVEGVAENLDANTFTRKDYVFKGWNTKEDGTGISYDDLASVTLTESITLYAQWEFTIATKYYVTFVGNGGSGSMDEQVFVAGVAGNLSANTFTRADYVFVSWNTKEDGTGTEYTNCQSITLTESVTLFAQWRFGVSAKYTVTFDANGGTGTMAAQEFEENVAENLDANAFTNDGYRFTGWNTEADGTGTAYADCQSVTLTESITLYAQWEEIEKPVTYTVEFKYADGSEALPAVTKDLLAAEDYVLKATDVYDVDYHTNPADYEFLGWTTTADGTDYKTSASLQVSIKTLEKVYYAQFKEIEKPVTYTVEFKYTDGSEALPAVTKDLLTAEDYVLKATDVKDVEYHTNPADYVFLGWTTTVDGTDYKTSASLQVSIKTLEKVYYAQFRHIDDVLYTVEHYFEQLDGSYVVDEDLHKVEKFYEKPGTVVTATALTTLPEGYEAENTTHPDRVTEGTVLDDGSLVLKLYYDLKVLTVTYYHFDEIAETVDEFDEMSYQVKYGGNIDNFYLEDGSRTNDEIKAEIADYLEYFTILGYGKDYDEEYFYNKVGAPTLGEYYDNKYFEKLGKLPYYHEINLKWYVEDAEKEYVLFDESHVFEGDDFVLNEDDEYVFNILAKVKKLTAVVAFPESITSEVLTINLPYEETTRFLDTIRDAVYINAGSLTRQIELTGIEDLLYDKLIGKGDRFFDGGIFNEDHEINNTDVMIYFYQMMGGKSEYRRWLWNEVEHSLADTLSADPVIEEMYWTLRNTLASTDEAALKLFFEDNYYGLDFDSLYSVAYNKYIDSKDFINASSEEDEFIVTANNEFIMEKVDEKIRSLASLDAVIDEYAGGRVPEGLLNRLPMDIVKDIYEPRVQRFLDDLDAARDEAKKVSPDLEKCMVDSGILFDVDLVEELLIPGMEFAKDSHEKAVDKAVSSGNRAAELIEKYYVLNPYTIGDAGNYGAVNYAFDPYLYIEDADSDGMYNIRSIENIYNEVLKPESVETVDALLWYMDPEGGAVEFANIRDIAEDNEDLILALHNHPHKLMKDYAENGLPETMEEYWDDLLSDPEIKKAVEKLDNKVSFDMMYFVESKIQNATLEMYFLKVLDKVDVLTEDLLNLYTGSAAYKELTSEDFGKLLDQLEECWETVEVDGEGVENANGTTDYVFDNMLEKVGSSGDVAEVGLKGFAVTVTRQFADYFN